MNICDISRREGLLLRAALHPKPAVAAASWLVWASEITLEEAPNSELRLLPAVYANLSRVAPELALPSKLRGKARANFTKNNLMAFESLPIIEELGRHFPVMLTKGVAICIRFGAWSSRPMNDVDLYLPLQNLEEACELLAQEGWTPCIGMTRASLVHRTALRRDSWNFTKGRANVDLHWGLRNGPSADWLTRQMWTSGEQVEFSGRNLLLQSPEFALVSTLNHGFLLGAHDDTLQTVVDAAWLLPRCQGNRLDRLLRKSQLLGPFNDLVSIFARFGLADMVSNSFRGRHTSDDVHYKTNGAAARRRPMLSLIPSKAKIESAVLHWPMVYHLWRSLGRNPRFERLLLWLMGPFSKPVNEPAEYKDDYDLCDCSVMDALGGPGWSWPEPDHTCFWSDRCDARLLIPLSHVGDHLIVLGLSEQSVDSPNACIDIFANGSYVTRIDFRECLHASEYCLVIPRRVLFGRWVELSFRPRSYLGDTVGSAEDYYAFARSVPVRRLRVLDFQQMTEIYRGPNVPELCLKIFRGEEPHASKWARIKRKMDTSPYKEASELPANFDPMRYVLSYADLFEHEVDPFEHFLNFGRHERRPWR